MAWYLRLVVALGLVWMGDAQAQVTSAQQAILLDMTNQRVLFERNADQRMPTSSLSKMMTVYVIFRDLADGRITLQQSLRVSPRAHRIEGARSFLEVGEQVSIEDLLRGVIVQSGNDASVVLAEGLYGSEANFALELNRVAAELGMTNSHFTNATGLPEDEHYSTARDMGLLAQRTIENFPQYYHYYSDTSFTHNGIRQPNRNPLLSNTIGADGLKTGHTQAGGFGLAGSVMRDGQRLILILNGIASKQARAQEAQALFDWGWRNYRLRTLFAPSEQVILASVWLGDSANVPIGVLDGVQVLLSQTERNNLQLTVRMLSERQLVAPVTIGQPVARLIVNAPDDRVVSAFTLPWQGAEFELVAIEEVQAMSWVERLTFGIGYILWGWLGTWIGNAVVTQS